MFFAETVMAFQPSPRVVGRWVDTSTERVLRESGRFLFDKSPRQHHIASATDRISDRSSPLGCDDVASALRHSHTNSRSLRHNDDDDCVVVSDSESSSDDEVRITSVPVGDPLRSSGGCRVGNSMSRIHSEIPTPGSSALHQFRKANEELLRKADEVVFRASVSAARNAQTLQRVTAWPSLDDFLASENEVEPSRATPRLHRSPEASDTTRGTTTEPANSTSLTNSGNGVKDILALWAVKELLRVQSQDGEDIRAAELELRNRLQKVQGFLQQRTHEVNELELLVSSLQVELERCSSEKEAAQATLEAERAEHDGNECVICWDRRASRVLVPCVHLAICDECRPGDGCPVCRSPYTSAIRMYKP